MPISVASRASGGRVPQALTAALGAIVRAALAAEDRRPGAIAIVLARDPELRELNRRWRGIDRATDVLSFPYADAAGRIDGDLVISLDRLAAQARRYRVSRGSELARLVVHGALHLAGLDHGRAAERVHMRRREGAVMRACATPIRALERALERPPGAAARGD
jgi:probable rRNA maturation factor